MKPQLYLTRNLLTSPPNPQPTTLNPQSLRPQVLLNNASMAVEFEDVQVDTNAILSDLHVHANGQQLIAATPYKVS